MKEKIPSAKIRFGTCLKDCYGSCVFKGYWNDDAIIHKFIKAIPSKAHPFTNGFFCPKYKQREDLVYHQERLKYPLIRTGPKSEYIFEKISLKKAFDLIAKILIQAREKKKSRFYFMCFLCGQLWFNISVCTIKILWKIRSYNYKWWNMQ